MATSKEFQEYIQDQCADLPAPKAKQVESKMNGIRERLFAMQDEKYRDFLSMLTPTVQQERIIGVRTPLLRAYARELRQTPEAAAFLQMLPHFYYEENNLHAFLIEGIRDFDACIAALDAFLPYVDNWATCDGMHPRALDRDLSSLMNQIRRWMASEQVYTIRFGVGMLMRDYLDAHFTPDVLEMVAELKSDAYYVNMMSAWFFATALAKQWDAARIYIEQRRLDPWVHNKAIQKAIESRRISPDQKQYLKKYKI